MRALLGREFHGGFVGAMGGALRRHRPADWTRNIANPAVTSTTPPRSVRPSDDGARLRIEWHDGSANEYAPRYLRLCCPCAGCVEEMTGRPLLDPARVPMEVFPHRVEYVGGYALRFRWSDGHHTGIYPWEYLREIAVD